MPTLSEDGSNIQLYVVYHKELELPDIPSLSFFRSDTTKGENIAHLADYCELRIQYLVWKNIKADYVGFFHYRRYLELNKDKLIPLPTSKRLSPYHIQRKPEANMFTQDKISGIVTEFDVIAPIWEYTGISVRDRYACALGHRASDLQLIEEIIAEKYSDFYFAAQKYLNGKGEYFGNIYIMKWEHFDSYCKWLFDILNQFDERVKDPLPRTDGYLGERLFGIYFTWMQHMPHFNCAELPRLHFYEYDDKQHRFSTSRLTNYIFPPGSRRRAILRSLKLQRILKGRKI